jgi:preprotein translocase SecE subunit
MARDRQRSKARQQQRREERLAQRREDAALGGRPQDEVDALAAEEREREELDAADLEVGAPPQDIGFSDRTLRDEPPAPSFETDDETLLEDDASGDGDGAGATPPAAGPRGVRGRRTDADPHKRGRLVAFLVAVVAELKRVQWPDRKQLTQLTGVVLFFVLIVGAYLGALDAIFSKLIQAIL